jgi:hypothetical protein
MKTRMRAMAVGAAVVVAGLLATSLPDLQAAAPPDGSQKTAILDCGHGWRGSAQGQYGGAGFTLSCQSGRDRQRLDGVAGTTYSVRMGAESESTALDCFFTGDAASVNETCGGVVRISVR